MSADFLESQFGISKIERELSAVEAAFPVKVACQLSLVAASICGAASIFLILSGNFIPFILALGGVLLFLRAPQMAAGAARRMALKEIEGEIPFALSYYSHLLRLGLSPVKALERLTGGFGRLGRILGRAILEAKKGKPLEKSIAEKAEATGSEKLEEAASAMCSVLSAGFSGGEKELLEGISKRQAEEKKAALEKYSSQSQVVFLGTIFTTAILPALAAFALSLRQSPPILPIVLFIFLFPLLAAAEFAYLRVSAP
jgi:Flp pilus assembly protein TadB